MAKIPHVKISASFHLKNSPSEHRGLTHVTWTFGNEPLSFGSLAAGFVYRLLEFYISVIPIPTYEINAQIAKLACAISSLSIDEEEVF